MSKSTIDILNKGAFKLVSTEPNSDMFYGKPYGGAMDQEAAIAANAMLNQNANLSVIECSLKAIKLKFNTDLKISITGAEMRWKINDKSINTAKAIKLKQGHELSGSYAAKGLRSYIAFDRLIKSVTEDTITLGKTNKKIVTKSTLKYQLDTTGILKIKRGPEWNFLSQEGKENMINFSGIISQDLDRMGAYIEGPSIGLKRSFPKSSVCTFPGVIQLLPNGQLVVLLRDAQTTGGYPRIAYLESEALNKFNQLAPGNKIEWRLVL